MIRGRQVKVIVAMAAAGAVAVAVVLFGVDNDRGPSWTVTIATATKGGTYYPLGSQLARILEGLPDERIDSAEARSTRGSRENIDLLMDSEASIAFAMGPALVRAVEERPGVKDTLTLLAHLYTDVVQVAVRKDAGIEKLADLESMRIFVGPSRSGTRLVATSILDAVGLSEGEYTADDAMSFAEAAEKLIDGRLSAAFFMAGMPAEAVQTALESGQVEILNLDDSTRETLTASGELTPEDIPTNFYGGQPQPVQTVGAEVFLVIRRDQPDDLAVTILEVLLDNIVDLLFAHQKAEEIRLTTLFQVPKDFPLRLHPGADQFDKEQESALLVATGALKGKYHQLGKMIQLLLNQHGIHAWAVHTDGSLDNAELLSDTTRLTIAIMQYDAALAARFGDTCVYRVNLSKGAGTPPVQTIRRLATLHEEQVHVMIRRETLEIIEGRLNRNFPQSQRVTITTLSQLAEALRTMSSNEDRLRVSLGPRRSATQAVAQAILEHHGIPPTAIVRSFLSVSDMADRLYTQEIDMGFFVSHVPSAAIETVMNDDRIMLLSLGSRERSMMASTVFTNSTIEPGTYASQTEGEPPIQSIATQAVLVTNGDLEFDVKDVTRAVFEGVAFLGVQGGKTAMARELPSLPLHPQAKEYYEEENLLPRTASSDWLQTSVAVTWRVLAILVILISGYRGLLKLRRDRTFNEMSRKIIAIPVEATFQDSVETLLEMRVEIQDRVRKKWWNPGELDKGRWRYLYDLVNDRIGEAKDSLMRLLAAEIRALADDPDLDDAARRELLRSVAERTSTYFEEGELDAPQCAILSALIDESSSQRAR
ncbi:MAG: TAXI family TRAP transporter solute-binding subunit [Gemmatimonadota bacterium]|nr:MAG: TAXI family TRAP transporter solute-binding subunit [Gemmatimonadota bacterium]